MDDQTFWDEIEAYCGRLSYTVGEQVSIHCSTKAENYQVVIERWGAERSEVWRAEGVKGVYTPPPTDADTNGCCWPVSLSVPVSDRWRSGFYLVTVTAEGAQRGRDVAHACFVVRASASQQQPMSAPEPRSRRSSTLLVLATNTWNADNTWGGKSLYTGGHQVSFARPFGRGILCRPQVERDDRKARPVRWGEDPDADGHTFQSYRIERGYPAAIGSTGWFTHERRFVEWAERAGHEFDMAVSSDLDNIDGLLDGYDLVLSVGHDEYWTAAGRDAVDTYIAQGGNWASFSGNTMFWQVRLVDDANHMVCYKYAATEHDPVVAQGDPASATGMWCDPTIDRAEWTTIGAGSAFGLYHRFGQATPLGTGGYTVVDPDHWMLAGTGMTYGDVIGRDHGVVGYETVGCPLDFDDDQRLVARPIPGQPVDVEIVGFALASNLGMGEYPKSISALSDQGDLEFVAQRFFSGAPDQNPPSAEALGRARRGNSVMLTCRPAGVDGGEVVTVGTTDWVFGLAEDGVVARVTANVLVQLTSGEE